MSFLDLSLGRHQNKHTAYKKQSTILMSFFDFSLERHQNDKINDTINKKYLSLISH